MKIAIKLLAALLLVGVLAGCAGIGGTNPEYPESSSSILDE